MGKLERNASAKTKKKHYEGQTSLTIKPLGNDDADSDGKLSVTSYADVNRFVSQATMLG